jgi:hypothetical protein
MNETDSLKVAADLLATGLPLKDFMELRAAEKMSVTKEEAIQITEEYGDLITTLAKKLK